MFPFPFGLGGLDNGLRGFPFGVRPREAFVNQEDAAPRDQADDYDIDTEIEVRYVASTCLQT